MNAYEGQIEDGLEPGVWHQAIRFLAIDLDLIKSAIPINEESKRWAWDDDSTQVAEWLSDGPREWLGHLVSGRPLEAKALDHDGCIYGWLTSHKLSELLAAFLQLDEHHSEMASGDFVHGFHSDLVECLAACKGQCLLIGA